MKIDQIRSSANYFAKLAIAIADRSNDDNNKIENEFLAYVLRKKSQHCGDRLIAEINMK